MHQKRKGISPSYWIHILESNKGLLSTKEIKESRLYFQAFVYDSNCDFSGNNSNEWNQYHFIIQRKLPEFNKLNVVYDKRKMPSIANVIAIYGNRLDWQNAISFAMCAKWMKKWKCWQSGYRHGHRISGMVVELAICVEWSQLWNRLIAWFVRFN